MKIFIFLAAFSATFAHAGHRGEPDPLTAGQIALAISTIHNDCVENTRSWKGEALCFRKGIRNLLKKVGKEGQEFRVSKG